MSHVLTSQPRYNWVCTTRLCWKLQDLLKWWLRKVYSRLLCPIRCELGGSLCLVIMPRALQSSPWWTVLEMSRLLQKSTGVMYCIDRLSASTGSFNWGILCCMWRIQDSKCKWVWLLWPRLCIQLQVFVWWKMWVVWTILQNLWCWSVDMYWGYMWRTQYCGHRWRMRYMWTFYHSRQC